MNFKTPLAVALGGAVFLSACGTDPARLNDPTNPNRNTNNDSVIVPFDSTVTPPDADTISCAQ